MAGHTRPPRQRPPHPHRGRRAPRSASLTIPHNIHDVGWWDGTVTNGTQTLREQAPQPGQPGVAILAGHVDSAAAGPGALYQLKDLKPGDTLQIDNLKGAPRPGP